MDMSQTIAPKSDQTNADDLIAGPRTITVTRVTGCPDTPEQPVAIFYAGDGNKPFKPCKSMRRVLVAAWGADASQYVGRSLTLYRDPEVMFGGMKVGGIRISHMSHLDRDMTMALTASKAQRKPYTVRVLKDEGNRRAAQDSPSREQVGKLAELAARQGTVTFKAFWEEKLTKSERQSFAEDLPRLKRLAAEADEKGAPDEGDPFSGGAGEREPGEEG